jgi:hypothetical protein
VVALCPGGDKCFALTPKIILRRGLTNGTHIEAGRSVGYLKYFLADDKTYNPIFLKIVKFFDVILPDLSLFN